VLLNDAHLDLIKKAYTVARVFGEKRQGYQSYQFERDGVGIVSVLEFDCNSYFEITYNGERVFYSHDTTRPDGLRAVSTYVPGNWENKISDWYPTAESAREKIDSLSVRLMSAETGLIIQGFRERQASSSTQEVLRN